MTARGFCFKGMEYADHIIVNIDAVATIYDDYRVFGNFIQHLNNSFLVQETYVQCQSDVEMLNVAFAVSIESKSGAISMFGKVVD